MSAGRRRTSRHVAQTMGPCLLALMLWSAISFWISPENNFVLQPLQRPQFATSLEPTQPVATACVLCGQVPGLRKRDLVGCNAGFEGSGLSGKWGCYKTEGDIDGYWKATGLPWLARKGLQLMDWGAGKNQNIREFSQDGDSIKMEYSFDGPGLGGLGFTETYTVGNGIQEITRMGGAKILVNPAWESDSVLRVQNMNPAKQTQGWAKTLLSGGQSEETQKQMVDGESKKEELGEVIDVHRFYLEDSSLVLEADSSPSGGPVVKWFLKKL